MKKLMAIAFAVAAGGFLASQSQAATEKIAGGAHDFTLGYTDDAGNTYHPHNMCSACHASHKAKKIYPLWSRADSAQTDWKFYDGTATGADPGTDGYLSLADFLNSKTGMCMSCHDGATAIGTSGYGASAVNVYMKSSFRGTWGTQLMDMHPVGKVIPVEADVMKKPDATSAVKMDLNDTVGCVSCHSIHRANEGAHALLISGERCLECHIK